MKTLSAIDDTKVRKKKKKVRPPFDEDGLPIENFDSEEEDDDGEDEKEDEGETKPQIMDIIDDDEGTLETKGNLLWGIEAQNTLISNRLFCRYLVIPTYLWVLYLHIMYL